MKFVLAFLLLIGISCQIGQGDCAPDTMYEHMKEMMSNGMQYVKNTYNEYMPNMPDITANMPSISVPDPVKDGYESIKENLGDMAKGAGDMAKDTMNGIGKAMDHI